MKINFVCNTCQATFSVDADKMQGKTGIVCPNCEAKMSSESFNRLTNGLSYIKTAETEMNQVTVGRDNNVAAFSFTFEG